MTVHAKHQTISLEDDLTFIDSLFDENNAKFTNSIMLHGFFTALVCSPTLIMPSKYMPVIWGEGNIPKYQSMEEVMRFHQTCSDLWNSIASKLHNNKTITFPSTMESKDYLVDWLEGFLYAADCLPDDWKILAKDKEASVLLVLIISMHQKYKEDENIDLDKDDILWLTKSINHIYDFFLALRTKHNFKPNNFYDSVELSSTRKIKRNDKCPCGSGKKYKKCCIDITFH